MTRSVAADQATGRPVRRDEPTTAGARPETRLPPWHDWRFEVVPRERRGRDGARRLGDAIDARWPHGPREPEPVQAVRPTLSIPLHAHTRR